MKNITEKQDDNERMLSKEIKITDEVMKRNYFKVLIIAFFGFELLIINLITISSIYIANIISINIGTTLLLLFLVLILLGITIGVYGLYGIYKYKPEKFSETIKITEEEIRRNYNKFLVITFVGFVSVIITLTIFYLYIILIFLFIPLGIVLGVYGSYGLYLHKRNPEKYRETLEKKLERKINLRLQKKMDRRKISIGLSVFGGILDIIIGITSLFRVGLMFGTIHLPSFTNFIGITFITSGILADSGALIEYKNLFVGGLLCLLTGIFSIVLTIIYTSIYLTIVYLLPFLSIFIFPTIFLIVGGILGILENKKMK